jgi:hypothetical protein
MPETTPASASRCRDRCLLPSDDMFVNWTRGLGKQRLSLPFLWSDTPRVFVPVRGRPLDMLTFVSLGLGVGIAALPLLLPAKLCTCAAAFPSCVRSMLTEIYLCHACSCQYFEILSGNAAAGGWGRPGPVARRSSWLLVGRHW